VSFSLSAAWLGPAGGDHNTMPKAHPGVRRAVDELVLGDGRFQPLLLAHTLLSFVKK